MASFSVSFRCPTTKALVLAEFDQVPDSSSPVPVECILCGKVHVIDVLTGEVKEADDGQRRRPSQDPGF